MLECLIIGDSIAVGTAQFRPECAVYAKVGINSKDWNNKYGQLDLSAGVVIISLGSNDHKGIHTERELERLRRTIKSKQVIWIIPAIKPEIQRTVKQIAEWNRDSVIMIPRLSKDGIHPSIPGYKEMATFSRMKTS